MNALSSPISGRYTNSGWWKVVYGEPDRRIRPFIVGQYQGWVEYAARPVRRREVPGTMVPLILNLGAPYRLLDPRDPDGKSAEGRSFIAGLHSSYALVESAGLSTAIQANFTPLGAILFLRMPLGSLANRTIDLEDVLGSAGRRLLDRLQDAASWETRFRILDEFVAGRIEGACGPSTCVAHALHRLIEKDGNFTIHELATEVGYSRKHLTAQFREALGLPPKTVARILRFGRAIRAVEGGAAMTLGNLARECGYFDQAHFTRDFGEFTGISPGEYLRRLVPAGGVIDP